MEPTQSTQSSSASQEATDLLAITSSTQKTKRMPSIFSDLWKEILRGREIEMQKCKNYCAQISKTPGEVQKCERSCEWEMVLFKFHRGAI